MSDNDKIAAVKELLNWAYTDTLQSHLTEMWESWLTAKDNEHISADLRRDVLWSYKCLMKFLKSLQDCRNI